MPSRLWSQEGNVRNRRVDPLRWASSLLPSNLWFQEGTALRDADVALGPLAQDGTIRIVDIKTGAVLLGHRLHKGDIWRSCQTKDVPALSSICLRRCCYFLLLV